LILGAYGVIVRRQASGRHNEFANLMSMKPRDIFKLAVRILGLIFLYHGLVALPTLLSAIFGGILPFIMMLLASAWPLFVAYILLRHAAGFVEFVYPESEDEG
jgi:hypothetical protein